MKRLLLGLLSSHPLALLMAVCLLPPATVWAWREALHVGSVERAIHEEGDKTRAWMIAEHGPVPELRDQIAALRIDAFAEIAAARSDLLTRTERQIVALRRDAFGELDRVRTDANARVGDTLGRVDRSLTLVDELRTSVTPAIDGLAITEAKFGALADTYSAVPDRLAYELRPAWLSIEPEITCRTLAGGGYGGCMRARINGMLGEGENAGATLVKQFPLFAASVNGILGDANKWTDKYVVPHPMSTGQKFGAVGKVFLGLGVAGLRGGVF